MKLIRKTVLTVFLVPSTLSATKDVVVEPKKQALISKPSIRALDAEIRWALKIVMMHTSYRSFLNLNELFMVMFPDSNIARSFKMSKTKVAYMTVYGIAEYFHRSFLSLLKKSPFLTPLFDESLNDILNKDQMESHICFYDVDSGTISTRYLHSRFVFCPNASVLSDEIINSIKDLDVPRMIMLRMDGPNLIGMSFIRSMLRGKNIIMLHCSMLAVVACI